MTNGSILLKFDKPYFVAGEVISGTCNLTVTNPVTANSLVIKYKGFERVKIDSVKSVSKYYPPGFPVPANMATFAPAAGYAAVPTGAPVAPGTGFHAPHLAGPNGETVWMKEHHTHKQEKEFFKSCVVLYNFAGGQVMPGNYSLPFAFQTPADLPGAFYHHHKSGDDEVHAAILYKVKANLDVTGTDIKQKHFVSVVPVATRAPKAVQNTASKGFLLASGKCHLTARIDKDVFLPGETVNIHVHCNNESSKNVAHLKIKLMRRVKATAEGQVQEAWEEVNRKQYDGVKAKSLTDIVLPFTLSEQAYPTTAGSIVECSYRFDVECDVKLAADLEVQLPIQVYLMPAAFGQFGQLFTNIPHRWFASKK